MQEREKELLTRQQQIGLHYYDDFSERIPRTEVTQLAALVRLAVDGIDPLMRMEVCGSYRRGLATCGDMDILFCSEKSFATPEQVRPTRALRRTAAGTCPSHTALPPRRKAPPTPASFTG